MNKSKKSRATFWRSLKELEHHPDFERYMKGEFPEAVDTAPDSESRRRFVQLMGASFALAGGAAACRWPKEELRPYTRRPEGVVPGVPRIFNTAMELGGIGAGLAVTSFDGRPLKVDGNPSHPTSRGKSTVIQQAQILELYDPDRSMTPLKGRAKATRDAFLKFAQSHFKTYIGNKGAGLSLLVDASSSPTRARLHARLAELMPKANWHVYESVNRDNEIRGSKMAFGKALRTHVDLKSAKVVLCLDCDVLDSHADAQRMARDWAAHRSAESGDMNRMYVVESRYSNTGAAADNRLPLRSEQIKPFVMALESAIRKHPTVGASVTDLQEPASAPSSGFLSNEKIQNWVRELVKDLVAHRGRCAVSAGAQLEPEVHAIVHRINRALGNLNRTVRYTEEPLDDIASDSLDALIQNLESRRVETLVVMGTNPVYGAPKAYGMANALRNAKTLIHLGEHLDETGVLAHWHVPRSHFLETWGDTRAYDGTVSLIQPIIDPLQSSFSDLEFLSIVLGEPQDGQTLVRETFAALGGFDLSADEKEREALIEERNLGEQQGNKLPLRFTKMERALRESLDAGFVQGSAWSIETTNLVEFTTTQVEGARLTPSEQVKNGGLELTFYPDSALYDGRFANNGWLQELPDYMTKLCWDNAAVFSPKTAERLGVHDEDLVRLTVGGVSIEAAALVVPGQATNSVAIALGYGRQVTGRLGREYDSVPYQTGFDVSGLRPKNGSMRVGGLKVEKTGKKYPLAATQDHWAIDELGLEEREKRSHQLVRSTELKEYRDHPDFVKDHEHGPQGGVFKLYEHPAKFDGHRWAMSIDLSKCTGCSACSIACQAENNIPVVGKEDVRRGREMHWIRIDRYFQGDPEEAQVAAQPVACMQCENAPCEQVCPVAATVHDEEGLNAMVYNRCIGTRYCSNNCPFKVRRFNWFQYHESDKNPDAARQHMMYNPEVTVRFRGVMEKCTYCSQRISSAKIHVKKVEKRPLRDGDIVTACQQACPTDAIVFGDLSDKKSRVSQLQARARAYGLLGELNLNVRTQYLAKITNPNSKLAPRRSDLGHGSHGSRAKPGDAVGHKKDEHHGGHH